MDIRQKRNLIGDGCMILLALLINVFSLIPMFLVEGFQSNWGKKFPFEWDDVIRRTIIATMTSVAQLAILSIIFPNNFLI